jgi:predicted Zn-dependent peptidase
VVVEVVVTVAVAAAAAAVAVAVAVAVAAGAVAVAGAVAAAVEAGGTDVGDADGIVSDVVTTSGPEPGITTSRLPDGIQVVTECVDGARSVCLGAWAAIGSRDEAPAIAGASHFLEHLLFKGTEQRSARQIARAVDAVGGDMNAFTGREHTAYYTRLPAADLAMGLDLLTDVLTAPALRPREIDSEREVILEELLLAEDTPDDLVHTALYDALFPHHPLGRETLGSCQTIEAMTRDDIAGFFEAHYRPANLVVAAAGGLEHEQVVAAVADRLGGRPSGERPARHAPVDGPEPVRVVRRDTEQVHVAVGWRGLDHDDPDRYALSVLNEALGGGPSSRLFQDVREERGLAYSVFSSTSAYTDTGSLVAYAGTVPGRVGELFDVVGDVIAGIVADGIDGEEHEVAVGCLCGSLVLGLEDNASRMARLGNGQTVRGHVISVEHHLARLRAVTPDEVSRVAARVLGGPRTVAVVGPVAADDPHLTAFLSR